MPSGEELEAYYGKHFNYSWYQQHLKKAQAWHRWRRMKFRFKKHGIQSGNFLDFGDGYGVFTRWMRDEGYAFFHYDQHCPNLFAPGHEADISGSVRYELATAFEVFEYIVEPAKTVTHCCR